MSTVARLSTSRYHRAICTSSFTYPNIEPPSPPDDENELVQTPTTQQGSHDTTQDKMSLWGTKKDNDGEDEHLHVNGESETDAAPRASHDDARPRSSRSRREPNERDRLLGAHNPPHSDGYLDPDDPAVWERMRDHVLPTISLINLTGLPLQPLDCPRPSLPVRPVPRHHLRLVGAAACEHLRFASRIAHQGFRLL